MNPKPVLEQPTSATVVKSITQSIAPRLSRITSCNNRQMYSYVHKHPFFQSAKCQEKHTRLKNPKMLEKLGKITDEYRAVSTEQ